MDQIVHELNPLLNYKHLDLFQSTDRILSVRGGANAGKTYSIADKLLLQSIWQADRKIKVLCVKKTLPSLRDSVIDILEGRAEKLKMPLDINKSTFTGRCRNVHFLFRSLNNKEDYEKIKSLTDLDIIWVNEINGIRENDFQILDTRIRGGEGAFKQFIFDFNPVGKTTWVYERFYEKNIGNPRKLLYTVLDNPWAGADEIASLQALKDHNLNLYKIYFEGEWGELDAVIYPNWDIVPGPPENPDDIFYGGDFGYSVNEAAFARIYKKGEEFWVEEVFYKKEMTNPMIGYAVKASSADKATSYWDSSEPKSIQELYDLDINAVPCDKGPDSVRAGIDYLQSKKIHIIDGSENIIKEQKSYVWKQDKDGHYIPEPVKYMDHMMDAIRYGIYTYMKHLAPAFRVPKESWV